ncbi:helix-turn-helix domain-containing protein [Patescibacteria group bacterium]
MKTVGEILTIARKKKGIALSAVAEKTKIRAKYLQAIEKNDFSRLPAYSTAYGFIQNYARFLRISSQPVLAVFRRDYKVEKKGKIVPRGLLEPLVNSQPKLIFSKGRLGIIIIFILFIIGYLGYQFFSLRKGPFLEVKIPKQSETVISETIDIVGKTDPEATLRVNGELASLSAQGEFTFPVNLNVGKNLIIIEAINRLERKTRVISEVTRLPQ